VRCAQSSEYDSLNKRQEQKKRDKKERLRCDPFLHLPHNPTVQTGGPLPKDTRVCSSFKFNDKVQQLHPLALCQLTTVAFIASKQHRTPSHIPISRAQNRLELVHSDIEEVSPTSHGGYRYFVLFIDDFSRMTLGFLMKYKNEVLIKFNEFRRMVEKATNCKIKRFRADNGAGEYTNKEFDTYRKKHGMVFGLWSRTGLARGAIEPSLADQKLRYTRQDSTSGAGSNISKKTALQPKF
jgi:hypothetical protein